MSGILAVLCAVLEPLSLLIPTAQAMKVAAEDGAEFEEILELNNGCLCCSIKDRGIAAIESLMDRKGAFDYVLLETTGRVWNLTFSQCN